MTPRGRFEPWRAAACAAWLAMGAMAAAHAADCPVPKGVDIGRVVPVVWPRASAEARFPAGARFTPTQHVNEALTIAFAEQTPKGLSYFRVPASAAPCWRERATLARTLSSLVREVRAIDTQTSPEGVVTLQAGGFFEASLILAQPILVRASGKHVEPLAVGIPARGQLFVADAAEPGAMAQLKARVDKAFREGPQPLSPHVFLVSSCEILVLRDGVPASEQVRDCTH